jgi:hypothetical protein
MERFCTKIIGESYDAHIRGSDDTSVFRHWEKLANEAAMVEVIEKLLTTNWRGRKIAGVTLIDVEGDPTYPTDDRISEKRLAHFVVIRREGFLDPMILPGKLDDARCAGTALYKICTANGVEFNDA